jgi:MtN3 and saliva related transmembrane protein
LAAGIDSQTVTFFVARLVICVTVAGRIAPKLSRLMIPQPFSIQLIGVVGAVLTTICWLPQAVRLIRSRKTQAISLITNLMFCIGLLFWLVYGIALNDWPLIGSNAISIVLTSVIIAMKLRHG